jgi:hypothetical protein
LADAACCRAYHPSSIDTDIVVGQGVAGSADVSSGSGVGAITISTGTPGLKKDLPVPFRQGTVKVPLPIQPISNL